MTTRLRRSRKLRGHRQMGYGRVGGHRKHPGGRGKAGALTHLRNNFWRYHPGYIGKHGQRVFHMKGYHYYNPMINIEMLWSLLPEESRLEMAKDKTKAPIIDVVKFGYFKVGGRGKLPDQPIIVRARDFTKKAEQKIKASGGCCYLSG